MKTNERVLFLIRKYWFILAILVVLVISVGAYQYLSSRQESENEIHQTTATIGTGDVRISAFGSGSLMSAVEMDLEFEYGGVIETILVESGDYVMEGDVLAVLDDENLDEALERAEADLRELTSEASVAAALLELVDAQKAVLTAESSLRFYISPYVFESEIRLQDAQEVLNEALKEAEENPSDEASQRLEEAQDAVEHAELSLALNWETYYEKYVPDFFNFPWRDRFGFWHDYYDPPSEIEVALVWAELAEAEAQVEEGNAYLLGLTENMIPDDAYGSQIVRLENALEAVSEAKEKLEAAIMTAPMDGVVLEIKKDEMDQIGTNTFIILAQLDPLTLEVWFDEGDWAKVVIGNSVEVIFDALPEKVYQGEIVFVDPTLQTNQNATYVSGLVELDTSVTGWVNLPLSSSASIEVIAGESQNAVLLPIEGLQEVSGDWGTVLVENGTEFTLKEVELGLRDVLFVEVINGLTTGEVVLIGELD